MMQKEFLESFGRCCICGRLVPPKKLVLRHEETGKILCLVCIVDIAEVGDKVKE